RWGAIAARRDVGPQRRPGRPGGLAERHVPAAGRARVGAERGPGAARGAEESTAWRQPVDLVALCEDAAGQLPDLFAAARGAHSALQTPVTRAYGWSDHAALAGEMLGDDPARIVDAITAAIRAGAAPADLADRSLTGQRCGWRASA